MPPASSSHAAPAFVCCKETGLITILRSDGDSSHRPAPKPSHIHSIQLTEPRPYIPVHAVEMAHYRYRAKLGSLLATYFQLPGLRPDAMPWRLSDLPSGYRLYKRVRLRNSHRKEWDYCIYGLPDQGYTRAPYRSPKEFFPHLVWLLTNPSNDRANCPCRQCLQRHNQKALKFRAALDRIYREAPPASTASGSGAKRTQTARPPSPHLIDLATDTDAETEKATENKATNDEPSTPPRARRPSPIDLTSDTDAKTEPLHSNYTISPTYDPLFSSRASSLVVEPPTPPPSSQSCPAKRNWDVADSDDDHHRVDQDKRAWLPHVTGERGLFSVEKSSASSRYSRTGKDDAGEARVTKQCFCSVVAHPDKAEGPVERIGSEMALFKAKASEDEVSVYEDALEEL